MVFSVIEEFCWALIETYTTLTITGNVLGRSLVEVNSVQIYLKRSRTLQLFTITYKTEKLNC